MKYLFTLLALAFLLSVNAEAQTYSYIYNPYAGMNKAQLNLALEQAHKMERNGKIWTTMGTGMLVGGSILTYKGINNLTQGDDHFGTFAAGLGVACFGAFPLVYGIAAWVTGSEKANMIEIQLLAFNSGSIQLKPAEYGIGLTLAF